MKAFLATFVGLLALNVTFAEPPTPDSPEQKRAMELVVQLGNTRFKERELAASELVKMGRLARKALEAGKANSDAEISLRCEQLLPQALALDLAHRVDLYLKDTEGKKEHDLPLLKQYQEKIGKGENERKLFGEMLKANGTLLETLAEQPEKSAEKIAQRTAEMYQEIYGNPLGGRGGYRPTAANPNEVACLLFATTTTGYKPTQPDWMMANLYTQPQFTNLLTNQKDGTAYRKVFLAHLEARMDDNTINQCTYMLCQYKIKEGADVLVKGLKDKRVMQVYTKANAIACVGALGGKEHAAGLSELLKDDAMVQQFFLPNGTTRGEVKIQDVALAITIHLSGKNPKDYGFKVWNVYPNQPIQYHQLGFASADERTAAFKKWNDDSKKPDVKKEEPKKEEPKKAEPKKEEPKNDVPMKAIPKPR